MNSANRYYVTRITKMDEPVAVTSEDNLKLLKYLFHLTSYYILQRKISTITGMRIYFGIDFLPVFCEGGT